jgi:2-oxoglutarate dehydrogenase E2 component (dihydrolipoamide succinyltransferase)
MADVTMPQLGETVTEGTITRWFKAVGDKVEADETLFEVSTDKVDSEVPSAAAGYLTEILVQEGETVDVGAKLAVISDQPGDGDGDGNGQAAPEADGSDGTDGADEATESDVAPPEAEPEAAAEAEAEAASTDPESDGGSGGSDDGAGEPEADGQSKPESAPTQGTEASAPRSGGRRVLSPVVRRLISENNLDPDDITGTGYDNRITRDDVLAHLDRGAAKAGPRQSAAVAQRPEAAPARKPAAAAATPRDEHEVIPFSNIRRRTAEHMVRSQATSAHVLTAIEVDFANVDKARKPARAEWKEEEGFSLTYLPFVSRAVIDAIREFPHVNASVEDDSLVVHRAVHLGIAVDINFEGLIVPVIHDADSKRLRSIARETADLANRARSKKLTADEIAGSTFTITNPGGYGTLITAPVINQPQVAIVSTDGVKKRPVVVALPDGTDGIAIHPVGVVAMTFDHRAFDGAYASAFVARVRDILETRDWSQEL